jgi:hypothetical protein
VNAQKKQLLMVGLLGVVLVGVLVFNITREAPGPPSDLLKNNKVAIPKPTPPVATTSGTQTPPKPAATSTPTPSGGTDINALLRNIKEVDFEYSTKKMSRDVMEPLVGMASGNKPGEPGKKLLNVSGPGRLMDYMKKSVLGILWNPVRPLAVVDKDLVYPGFKYDDGGVVESIEPDSVTFKFEDVLIPVSLKEEPNENLKEQ